MSKPSAHATWSGFSPTSHPTRAGRSRAPPALTPWAGRRTGPEEIRQSLTAFFAAVEPLAFEVQTMVEVDGRLLVPGRYVSRFQPSRQVLESEMILRFTVVGGLISDYRVFEDSLGITRTYLGEPLTAAPT
ncbi:nuclear transport factor 2 family protein [Streptomyces coeruleorubidus]|uniref:nuclear transport factor 2 family protein n=1 Tax=Streptomyces coeruleorubidus TaxID=116188 RepID=UPI0036F8834D